MKGVCLQLKTTVRSIEHYNNISGVKWKFCTLPGVIELITESETLRKIQVSSGVTGSFKDRTIKEWLQRHNPTELEYNKVRVQRCCSYCCAAFCIFLVAVSYTHLRAHETG